MDITVYKTPNLLLEAAELVYSMLNQISPASLTAEGKFCISPKAVEEIRKAACEGLDWESEELQFYFQGVPIGGQSGRLSCLASCLLYSSLVVEYHDIDSTLSALAAAWEEQTRPLRIHEIDGFALSVDTGDPSAFQPLSQEVAKLPVPVWYQTRLVDVLTDFRMHLCRVGELLRPVVDRLAPLLEPWVQRAQLLAEQWEQLFSKTSVAEFLRNRTQIQRETIGSVQMALRYFSPVGGPVRILEPAGDVRLHIGLAVSVTAESQENMQSLIEWEYDALRLLSSPDRVKMLQAMMTEYQSRLDLVQRLGLHSGSVFRDLNSMYNARLLMREVIDGKNCYRTNLPVVRDLFRHVLDVLTEASEQESRSNGETSL